MKKRTLRTLQILALSAALTAGFISPVNAAATDLDVTFSGDGLATTAIDGGADLSSMAVQADGKIVVAGTTNDYVSIVARYNTDGTLDSSFDSDGKVLTPVGSEDLLASLAIQSDGKIVVAGTAAMDAGKQCMAVVRYNSNGSLDTSFDTDGKAITEFAGDTYVSSMTIQTDGKIIVAAHSGNELRLARYNTNGSLDTSFDTDGKAEMPLGTGYGFPLIAIRSDGKIIVGGKAIIDSEPKFTLARFNSNGSLDTTFDSDGISMISIGNQDWYDSIALQTDEKIIVGGSSLGDGRSDFALTRFNSDGSLDTSFDSDGKVTTLNGIHNSFLVSMAIQGDGKIVAVGYADVLTSETDIFTLVRYNIDGSLDPSFGTEGRLAIAFNNEYSRAMAVVIQTDGKIIVGGKASLGDSYGFALARLIGSYIKNDSGDNKKERDAAAAAAAAAQRQRELTEIFSLVPAIAGLALTVASLTNVVLGIPTSTTSKQKCVKASSTKYVKKGAKCPTGYKKT